MHHANENSKLRFHPLPAPAMMTHLLERRVLVERGGGLCATST